MPTPNPGIAFAERLRQATVTGVLDLTNQELNPVQIAQIKECIANTPLKQCSLLGVKPIAALNELMNKLAAKSRMQETPIKINHTVFLERRLADDFNRQFRQQALDREGVGSRFEPSRLGNAYSIGGKAFLSQVGMEMRGEIPRFGGKAHFTQVTAVKKLVNPSLEERYSKTIHNRPITTSSNFLTRELQTIQTPDASLKPGEMLLFHGTNATVSPLIMHNGFDEERCKLYRVRGYGPLGKGVYFTSEIAKAATFATCTVCGQYGQCNCVEEGTNKPADRVVLLCKVFVGNPEVVLKKSGIKNRTEPKQPFDSSIGLSNKLDTLSEFRATEVCVPRGNQVVPLYEIRFSSQPNLLDLTQWQQMITNNGLRTSSDKNIIKLVEVSEKLIIELNNLREVPAQFSAIKNQAMKIESLIKIMIKILAPELRALQKHPSLNEDQRTKLQLQLRDLNNLQNQLQTLQNQSEDYTVTKKAELPKTIVKISLVERFLRFILPKEYAIKNECARLEKTMNQHPGTPDELLTKITQWLNLAIERDQDKGKSIFGDQPMPFHRMIMVQKMINLRNELRDLQQKKLPKEELAAEMKRLIGQTLGDADRYASINPRIAASTSYKNLSLFQKIMDTLMPSPVNPILMALSSSVSSSKKTVSAVPGTLTVPDKAPAAPNATPAVLSNASKKTPEPQSSSVDPIADNTERTPDSPSM